VRAFYPHAAEGKTATEHEIALSPFCYAESHQSVLFICGERTNKENGVGRAKHFLDFLAVLQTKLQGAENI
jgi:hypothetical protein